MQKIIADSELPQKLQKVMHPVEVVDHTGRVLGVFKPDLSQYEGLEPDISEEELDRIAREGGGRTLAEILADLEKRQ